MVEYVWRGIETPSLERLSVAYADSIRVASVVDGPGARHEYELRLTADWVLEDLVVRAGDRRLHLRRSPDGSWLENGEPRPDLADAIDIDLQFSPFTNTLPMRRVDIRRAGPTDIVTAWVARDTLEVTTDPQRYTWLAPDRYRFESLDTDFEREITVDDDAFVVEYPGLFARVTDYSS